MGVGMYKGGVGVGVYKVGVGVGGWGWFTLRFQVRPPPQHTHPHLTGAVVFLWDILYQWVVYGFVGGGGEGFGCARWVLMECGALGGGVSGV